MCRGGEEIKLNLFINPGEYLFGFLEVRALFISRIVRGDPLLRRGEALLRGCDLCILR